MDLRQRNAAVSSCFALFIALLATFSPLILWSPYNKSGLAFSTGAFVMTRLYTVNSFTEKIYQFDYGSLDDSVCSTEVFNVSTSSLGNITLTDNYNTWSNRYGFCDSPDGSVKVPSSIKALQAFTILSLVLTLIATMIAFTKTNRFTRLSGFFTSLLALAFSIATFSQSAGYAMYSDLRKGNGYLPVNVYISNTTSTVFVGVPVSQGMAFTPGYYGSIIQSLLLIYTTFAFFQIRTLPEDDISFEERDSKGHSTIHPEAMYSSAV